MVFRADFSMSQDIVKNIGENKNTLQIRMDILNVGNLLNRDWGVSQRLIATTPLVVRPNNQGGPVDGNGEAIYRLQNVGNLLLGETAPGETGGKSYQQTLDVNDVFRIQFGVRYIFN